MKIDITKIPNVGYKVHKVRMSKDMFTKDSPYKPKTYNGKTKKSISKKQCRNNLKGICLDISI